jgi:hypothetical protein
MCECGLERKGKPRGSGSVDFLLALTATVEAAITERADAVARNDAKDAVQVLWAPSQANEKPFIAWVDLKLPFGRHPVFTVQEPSRRPVVGVAHGPLIAPAQLLDLVQATRFADSLEFLEDASVNTLIVIGPGWSARNRARLGMLLATHLMVRGLATLWTAWTKLQSLLPPDPLSPTAPGAGALIINLSVLSCQRCAEAIAAVSPRQPACLLEAMRSPISQSS